MPTVPSFAAPGGLAVAAQLSSDMPQTSHISSPRSWKNSSTSSGVGAAPTSATRHWSNPSFASTAARASAGIAAGSVTPWASSAALIFSQMRGTATQTVGRASGSAATISRGSATTVIVVP